MAEVVGAGAWPSPVTPERVAEAGTRLGGVQVSHPVGGSEAVWWDEQRPAEGGRTQIIRRSPDGALADVLPSGFSASSRAHEYGGGAWWLGSETVFFVNDADQRIWRLDPGFAPIPLTPEPVNARGWRYADGVLTADFRWIVCVGEIHPGEEAHDGRDEAVNALVAIPATGGVPVALWSGSDFVSTPRIDPETQLLAWLAWNHPDMPWDSTELWVGGLDGSKVQLTLSAPERVAGGGEESLSQPEWDQNGRLWFVSDRSNWWNLYRFPFPGRPIGDPVIEAERPADIALPQWVFGTTRWAFLSDARVVFASSADGLDSLAVLDMMTGKVDPVPTPLTSISQVTCSESTALVVGSSFTSTPSVQAVLVGRHGSAGGPVSLSPRPDLGFSSAYVSVGQPISYPTTGGARAHGFFYSPTNPGETLIGGERPPLVVLIHGGPVSAARPELRMIVQFWTTRGFAVVDVNHRGSTGFGRRYRKLLRGQWGVVDVEDCVAAVRFLSESGRVDPSRAVIRGGSAGGFTTLAALAGSDVFAAGASYYGIADLAVLATDTHKFESHDLERLVGPWPEAAAVYRERSPLFRVADIVSPVIIFQGSEDRVVPPVQAELIVAALREQGVPHAYVLVEGEGHGFRQAENISSTLAAECSFYAQVLGLAHPDGIEPVEIWRP